jgi:IS605 OrfB family transposase
MPIPYHDSNEDFRRARFEELDGEIFFNWLDGIRFRLNFGRDRSNNREIIQRVLACEYGLSDSSLQLKEKKIFLLLCVRIPEIKHERDQNLSLGVDLGINVPAYWALSAGPAHYPIGTRKDFLDFRTRTAARRRQLQGALKLTQGGRGRKKKLKALDRYQKSERNYVHTYNHNVSREVINAANKYNVGTIKLELLEGYGRDEEGKQEKSFLLRNWSYFELQKMIEDKAKREGIDVKYIDPYHTSKACALCGSLGERPEQAIFICKYPECANFEKKVEADYNAALNIARSTKYVTSKEECQYWRRSVDETKA